MTAGGARGRLGRLAPWAALGVVLVLGLAHLWVPLDADQTFFLYTARLLDQGKSLYRDVWDVKQPGIFLFYLAAGKLASFDGCGVHLLELAWMAGMAGAAWWWGRQLGNSTLLLCGGPLLTAGYYYLVSGAWQFGQIEGEVGFPFLVAVGLPLSCREPRRSWLKLLLAGFAGGIILVFKTALGLLLFSLWGAGLLLQLRHLPGRRLSFLCWSLSFLGAGLSLPLLAVALWTERQGSLASLIWTTFVFPTVFSLEESRSHFYASVLRTPEILYQTVTWLAGMCGPLIILSALGAYRAVKERLDAGLLLLVWVGMGSLTVLLQTWWTYQVLLILPALGLLACLGLEQVAAWWPARRAWCLAVSAAVLLAALPLLSFAEGEFALLLRHWPFFSPKERAVYQTLESPFRRQIEDEAAFLREPGALPGPIFAPEWPYSWAASGRALVRTPFLIANSYLVAEQRRQWLGSLERSRPSYIRMSRLLRERFNRVDPAFQEFLDREYRRVEGHPPWYVRVH